MIMFSGPILLSSLGPLPLMNRSIHLPCANITNGHYHYIEDLLQLEAFSAHQLDPGWPRYRTPVEIQSLHPFLAAHPDQAFAGYMYNGLTNGFRIGYIYRQSQPPHQAANHVSELANRHIVKDKVDAEVAAGRLLGPLPTHLASLVQVSPLGLVPKAHQENKWRLIMDLSYPSGYSINDGIPPALCSLHYASVDNAVDIIKQLGRGAQLVKLDVKDAYRIVPVHPSDYCHLGLCWQGKTYIDRALPFGLRSAPKIFTAVADLIAWILHQQGIRYQLHYLDDYLFLGAPNTHEGAQALQVVLNIFKVLGIPVATHKTEGPTTVLAFLGILIDTQAFELRLPPAKLTQLQSIINSWSGRTSCTKKDLRSLLGHLSHAATVIVQGRTFLRQLFPLLYVNRPPQEPIRLSAGARADLMWWKTFLQGWNGRSFFPASTVSSEVTSDASGSYGCGAFSSEHTWFQLKWPDSWLPVQLQPKSSFLLSYQQPYGDTNGSVPVYGSGQIIWQW